MSFRSKHPRLTPSPSPEQGAFFKEPGSQQAFFSAQQPAVQAKLTIGQPNDAFEQEADAVADQVVNQPQSQSSPEVQREEQPAIMPMSMEEEEMMQGKPELMKMEEEEEMQMKPEIMKMDDMEEEEMQMKPEIMREEMPEEGEMMMKPELMKMEEEEEMMMKPEPGGQASASVSQQITGSRGRGQKLPASTAQEMSAAIGHDFSDVTIHTDQESTQLNRSLGAQAFTHGQDVYFNEGKFSPDSSSGKHLLAHELTHVVQQSK